MSQGNLLANLRDRRDPEATTLAEYLERAGAEGWNRLRDVARRSPQLVDDAAIAALRSLIATGPGSFFALLIDLVAKAEDRRQRLFDLYHELLPSYPAPALAAAGYNLHEHCRLLDARWLAAAQTHFDADPDGAWGIFESAAMYQPKLVTAAQVDWLDARRTAAPRDHIVAMLSLADHRPEQAAELLARVLRAFPEHPAAAVDATAFAARDAAPLLTPGLVAAVLAHFTAPAERAWEFFAGACRARPEIFDEALLDALTAHTTAEPGTLFTVLRHLIDVQPERTAALLDRYVALLRRHPKEGIQSARYAFSREDSRLMRPDLVTAVCDGFAANAYPGYEFLRHCAEARPELLGPGEVDAALRNIVHATNYAFGFFKVLLELRPEFTRECTLALFECLAQEPVNRAFVRAEEMESIIAISEAAHIRTGLERSLREPPQVGSRRARALMAIMFRQKLRARRQVLLEALRYAATVVLWRKIPPAGPEAKEESEKFSPVWDFVMFIIDSSGDDAVSTAAAERFLEGAFQLHYLCRTGAEHEGFLRKLDIGHPPAVAFPPIAGFLDADPGLCRLYHVVVELGRRFATVPRIVPLDEFADRRRSAENELRVLEGKLARSEGRARTGMEERVRSLRQRIACWSDPAYQRAFADAAAERLLAPEAAALLKQERKDLAKRLRDALQAEAIRIAVAAVEGLRLELYRNRLRDALGRDIAIETVEPKILPAFLWFSAIGDLASNTRYLKRLIEDRVAGQPHDWLRSEPAALAWAERVRAGQPGIVLERWRAPFAKEFQYRPKDSLAEKRRRIKSDLAQARALLERAGAQGIASESYAELAEKLAQLKAGPPTKAESDDDAAAPRPEPALLDEIAMNLERVRLAEQSPDSDYEGKIILSVESDPFEILFMGEYGFASCLSLRGPNAWSAVSNAIDIDKTVVWAKEPGGNVVGRRLLVLMPEGVLAFRTYSNRHGLALDRPFDEFIATYAAHCGAAVAHGGHPRPLLSDRWYDDGAL